MRTSPERLALSFAFALAAVALSACPEQGAGETGCIVDGQRLEVGQTAPKGDGCNSCICAPGRVLQCSERDCSALDGGTGGEGEGEGPTDAGRPPSSCVDRDGDGFFTCADPNYPERPAQLDCDDDRFFVQPGGYDFEGNGIDDDCDDDVDELPACACAAASTTGMDLLGAADLCDGSIVNATKLGDAVQFATFQGSYFTNVTPQVGDCLIAISTGDASTTSDLQVGLCSSFGEGCFDDPDPSAPADSEVFDLAQLTTKLNVPTNARGLSFRFMFMSAEWPEYLCKQYNDTFYALVESNAVADRARTNFAFDPLNRPITVNVGFFEAPRDWTTDIGTTPFGASDSGAQCTEEGESGYQEGCILPEYCTDTETLPGDLQYEGSGTGWLTASTPVEPGEQNLNLTFSIHDEGDGVYDSIVLIDEVRWLPYEPPLGVVKE